MLKFTDTHKFVMGVGIGYATDIATGDVKFWSEKFQDGNISVAASEQVLNAGIGNGPAIILYSDPNISVTLTQADYNEYIHAAAAGARITGGAPVEACQIVNATGTSLSIDVSGGTPIAGPGMTSPVCYVQEVGAASEVATGGAAYAITAAGAITGFVAASGKSYRVTYFKAQANATLTTYGSNFNSAVVRFVFRQPIYTNYDPTTNQGDLWGWKITVIPFLKLNPSTATQNGSQSSFTTTAITGRALTYDDPVVSGVCDDCALPGSDLAYTIIAPCGENAGIQGIIGILGGALSLKVNETYQLNPGVVVGNAISYGVPASDFSYASSAGGVTVGASTGLITAGSSATSADITITYTVGEETYTDTVAVEVTTA